MSARDIIIRPIVTEKTMKLSSDENKITFEVARDANKTSVKQAIKEIYNISAERVSIINQRPRLKKVGKYQGMTKAVKKAIVSLPAGQSIDLFNNGEKK